jgi:hypothetical protein
MSPREDFLSKHLFVAGEGGFYESSATITRYFSPDRSSDLNHLQGQYGYSQDSLIPIKVFYSATDPILGGWIRAFPPRCLMRHLISPLSYAPSAITSFTWAKLCKKNRESCRISYRRVCSQFCYNFLIFSVDCKM